MHTLKNELFTVSRFVLIVLIIHDFLLFTFPSNTKIHAKKCGINYWYYPTRLVQPIGRVSKVVGILSLYFCLREVIANSISSETCKFRYVELIVILLLLQMFTTGPQTQKECSAKRITLSSKC